jgi:hypothetical protein
MDWVCAWWSEVWADVWVRGGVLIVGSCVFDSKWCASRSCNGYLRDSRLRAKTCGKFRATMAFHFSYCPIEQMNDSTLLMHSM